MTINDNHPTKRSLSAFDKVVIAVIIALFSVIAFVALRGDQVGVQITAITPTEEAHSTEAIALRFSEVMNRDSVVGNFAIEPSIDGSFSWSGDLLSFQPDEPMIIGEQYTVTVSTDARSLSNRQLFEDYQYSFTVRAPFVAYLSPSNASPQNIFIADSANPDDVTQVTFSQSSIFDFAVSPDGNQIAYAEYVADSPDINIHLLTLATGETQQITECQEATCTTPVWRPDGEAIAYQRIDRNTFTGGGIGPTYVWLNEFTDAGFNNRQLFEDFQLPAYAPQWSEDGNRIAVFDPNAPGNLVYDLTTETLFLVPSPTGTIGSLSDDGTAMLISQRNFEVQNATRGFIRLATLETSETEDLTPPSETISDTSPIWHPDNERVTFIRRYYDDDALPGSEIMTLNTSTGDIETISDDLRFSNNNLSWDPTGTLLTAQRFPILDENGERNGAGATEVWVYNSTSDEWIRVATNAYLPQWLP